MLLIAHPSKAGCPAGARRAYKRTVSSPPLLALAPSTVIARAPFCAVPATLRKPARTPPKRCPRSKAKESHEDVGGGELCLCMNFPPRVIIASQPCNPRLARMLALSRRPSREAFPILESKVLNLKSPGGRPPARRPHLIARRRSLHPSQFD